MSQKTWLRIEHYPELRKLLEYQGSTPSIHKETQQTSVTVVGLCVPGIHMVHVGTYEQNTLTHKNKSVDLGSWR